MTVYIPVKERASTASFVAAGPLLGSNPGSHQGYDVGGTSNVRWTMPRWPWAAAALALLPACAVHGLSLVADDRVDIVSPADRSDVSLPVTVAWEVDDFGVGPGGGSFGVFVDRPPQPPGHTLAWLFRDADDCAGVVGCPDDAYLALRDVHRTTGTSFTVERVTPASGERRHFHEVTVVLLDAGGRRVGEGAWSVQFAIDEDGR